MTAPRKPDPRYYQSIFYQPALRILSPQWYFSKQVSVIGILVSVLVVPWIAGASIWTGLSIVAFVGLAIVSRYKLAQSIPAALLITEDLSRKWFDKQYTEQSVREQKIEIRRLKSVYLDKLHPHNGPLVPGGGTMYGARGEKD